MMMIQTNDGNNPQFLKRLTDYLQNLIFNFSILCCVIWLTFIFVHKCDIFVLQFWNPTLWLNSPSVCLSLCIIDHFRKSHKAPVPYPTMHHSEQKCAHFCSEWCIVGYGTGVLRDLCNRSIVMCVLDCRTNIQSQGQGVLYCCTCVAGCRVVDIA